MARRQTTGATAIIWVLVAAFVVFPVKTWAQEPVKVLDRLNTRLFDAPSLVRAIEADRDLQAAMRGQESAATARKNHRVRNSVLIGAGVGALAGGVLPLTSRHHSGSLPDYRGERPMIGAIGADAAAFIGIFGGAALGAGIGAIVGLLIK